MDFTKKLAVFDIDGTITKEGNDSWFETTDRMVTDQETFKNYLSTWKENKASNPYGASLIMMEQAISLFPDNTDSKSVYEKAKSINEEVIANNQIRESAIAAIHKHFKDGLSVVFATTSYMEAGLSLLDILVEKDLITREMSQKIVVSGTEVDWTSRKIIHFNMSEGKIQGVAKILKSNVEAIQNGIMYAYGDDPLGNDSGILSAADFGFIIHTIKNAALETNNLGERVQW